METASVPALRRQKRSFVKTLPPTATRPILAIQLQHHGTQLLPFASALHGGTRVSGADYLRMGESPINWLQHRLGTLIQRFGKRPSSGIWME